MRARPCSSVWTATGSRLETTTTRSAASAWASIMEIVVSCAPARACHFCALGTQAQARAASLHPRRGRAVGARQRILVLERAMHVRALADPALKRPSDDERERDGDDGPAE